MSIRSEIETRLAQWASAQTPKLPVAYENVSFNKPTTGNYIEVFMLKGVSTNREITATGVRITGKFQINVYTPVNTGMGVVEALADAIIDLYPVVPKTGTVSIEAPLETSAAFVLDGYMCLPITGRYRVET